MAKPKYPETCDERARVYLHCMLEIKERVKVIETVSRTFATPLFAKEICFLQLRYICELIAVALLTAQGDFKTQRAFTEEYSPPKIFAALKVLYPQFFPQPAVIRSVGNVHHIEPETRADACSEEELLMLWNSAGSHLHRASCDHYFKKTFGPQPQLADVQKHLSGIINLLECHLIKIQTNLSNPLFLHVILNNEEGETEVNFLHVDEDAGTISIERLKAQMV